MNDIFSQINTFANGVNNVFNIVKDFLRYLLLLIGLPPWIADIVMALLNLVGFLAFAIPVVMSLVYLERRVIAFIQDRLGPNRTGPEGVLQSVADVVKLFSKEDIVPANADPWAYKLATFAVVIPALLIYTVIPFGPKMVIADLNIGVLFFVAVGSVTVVGVLMAGWGSNNKFALLGAMRAAAQVISYEIPLVFAILGVVMVTGSLSTVQIVNFQSPWLGLKWNIILQPVGFVIFMIAAAAEVNRTPFDLMEAESEIVAGYHTEYSGIRFALFFLAEYLESFGLAALAVTLFLGGWNGPILPAWLWFVLKTYAVFFLFFWTRGTLPRVRVDQLMSFSWKVLLPLALANMVVTGIGLTIYNALV
jgi:NADH-quinone oxidoreductase subunit H